MVNSNACCADKCDEGGIRLIGCGLMGRKFASAVSRCCHLPNMDVRVEVVASCDRFDQKPPGLLNWYTENFSTIPQITANYLEILANPAVKAVYIAVPDHLHQEFHSAALEAGKHSMGERPLGIDKTANAGILEAQSRHHELVVRCSSEFPFYPSVQRIGQMIEDRAFGRIIEVNCGFLHPSDLDPNKPMNWKRKVEINGEYGCMGTRACTPAISRFEPAGGLHNRGNKHQGVGNSRDHGLREV